MMALHPLPFHTSVSTKCIFAVAQLHTTSGFSNMKARNWELPPARKYEYLVLASGILLVCYKMKDAQSAALQKATCVHFV